MSRLDFFDDPDAFLAAAGDHLAADPVLGTVVATVTTRLRGAPADALPVRRWWVAARDGDDRIVGVGMRTAPFAPYPLFLLPMPTPAAVAVAGAMRRRGELAGAGRYGVNGALEPARACAEEIARLTGGTVEVALHTRLFELTDHAALGRVRAMPSPPGRLRPAGPQDIEVVREWFGAFLAAADVQAGRRPGAHADSAPGADDVPGRIAGGEIWLWQDERGEPVHVTAASAVQFGVSRIGPVYTPDRCRGGGYATAAVAAVTGRLLAAGARVCLFTDQANPTSNALYRRIGFTPVVDMVNLLVAPDAQAADGGSRRLRQGATSAR